LSKTHKNQKQNSPLRKNKKYILDISDLQFKQVHIPWNKKILRGIIFFIISIVISAFYLTAYENSFGSPKEFKLQQDIENIKLQYSLLNKKYEEALNHVNDLKLSDEKRYRPILDMDSLPSTYRNPAYGGVDRYRDLEGFDYSSLIIDTHQKLDALNNMARVQEESFSSIDEARKEWTRQQEYLPKICPVDPSIPRGDPMKFRKEHPVLGFARWHLGQDFQASYGTDVYATGNGTVVVAASLSNTGFGSYVVINHGYGFESIYGHLSKILVSEGMNIKRGDLIGLSGNTGTSSGPHLHYQINYNGAAKNPLEYFSDDLTPDEYKEMITVMSSKSKYR
jgi:murein DD-endopeptidase MepM/ murein hydrolase activator NlpD